LRRGGVSEGLFGYSRDFPFQLINITVVLRTRTDIFQGRDVNKYLLKNMERMYRLCKESLWIRLELSENCFHSVVKIILINYAKKDQTYSCLGWCESTITDTIVSPVINHATFWIYVTHDNKLCNKSKKFTSIFNNKLNKRCFLLSPQEFVAF
jgi:hypothetical protein